MNGIRAHRPRRWPVLMATLVVGVSAVGVTVGLCVALSVASGCSVLPTVSPGARPHSRPRVPWDGIRSPLTEGNAVVLLEDGPATYAAMLAAIAGAVDHINLETYILDDDEVGQRFARALLAKRAQGVQINLLRDSAGTFSTPAAYFETLAAGGIQVTEFNPINPLKARQQWEWNERDHRKLLIVDGRIAFLGGINISGVYSGGSLGTIKRGTNTKPQASKPAWRDTDLQLTGPVVAELQKLFIAAWTLQQGAPLVGSGYFPALAHTGTLSVRAIGSSPDEAFSQMYTTLLAAIANAHSRIAITMAYFVPDPQLLTALESAAARGVDVQLILPGHTDSWMVFHACRASYGRLLRAGVKLHERRGALLHSKTALIDGTWATVGSTNLDWRSFLHNHELNAVVLGAGFGQQLQDVFDRDLAASERITLTRWEARGALARVQEWLARVWEYWL